MCKRGKRNGDKMGIKRGCNGKGGSGTKRNAAEKNALHFWFVHDMAAIGGADAANEISEEVVKK